MNYCHICHVEYSCRFRRQHEQLRQVIVRVLRPVTSKQKPGTPLEEVAPKLEPVVDEAADANAIEVGDIQGNTGIINHDSCYRTNLFGV